MRSLSFLLFIVPVALVFAGADCSSSSDEDVCSCPSYPSSPQIAVSLPCGTSPLPTVALSGVCAGSEQVSSGQIVFGSNTPGDCQVTLTFANGSTFSTDVPLMQEWLACGSDPHGCGSIIVPDLPDGSPPFELVTGPQCVDSGTADAAASEASADKDGEAVTSVGGRRGRLR